MNLTEEQLKTIEEFANMPHFSITNIADVLQVDPDKLGRMILLENSPAAVAFKKGRLMSQAEFGKKLTQLSNQGSGPAQSLVNRLRNETELNSIIEYYG